eukprot:7166157-Prymnesium_polylepis.1
MQALLTTRAHYDGGLKVVATGRGRRGCGGRGREVLLRDDRQAPAHAPRTPARAGEGATLCVEGSTARVRGTRVR